MSVENIEQLRIFPIDNDLSTCFIMVSYKKQKKNADNMNSNLQLVLKSGKFTVGSKTTKKCVRSGKAKMVIIANNLPKKDVSYLEYCCLISKIKIHYYNGTNIELGTACGRYYPISVLSIIDQGDSDIFKATE